MEHLIAIGSLGLVCIVWFLVGRASGRPDGGCGHSCIGCTGNNDCEKEDSEPSESKGAAGSNVARTPQLTSRSRALGGTVALIGLVIGGAIAQQVFAPDSSGANAVMLKVERPLMGTRWVIEAAVPDGMSRESASAAVGAALDEVARVESVMSEWKADSPLSAINANAGKEPVPVPTELRDILLRSVDLGKRSSGAFDVTWRGMGPIWRFGDPEFVVPASDVIEAARRRVDYRKVVFQTDRVGLTQAGMSIGLGGIAKGYGVDRAVQVLGALGLRSFFVDGGGDVRVAGGKHGKPWRVGIRHPRGASQEMVATVAVMDGAVVTSGDYERFKIVDGIRYHHIIDPSTGRPAKLSQSVTIVSPTAELADGLATAVFVLGPEKGLALVETEPGTEALVVDASGRTWASSGFARVGRLEAEKRTALGDVTLANRTRNQE